MPVVTSKRHSPDGARSEPNVVEEYSRPPTYHRQNYVHLPPKLPLKRTPERINKSGHCPSPNSYCGTPLSQYQRRGPRSPDDQQQQSLHRQASRVFYASDGRYMRYPQPSPPKPYTGRTPQQTHGSNGVIYDTVPPRSASGTPVAYKTSTPVKSVTFSGDHSVASTPKELSRNSSCNRSEPSGESTKLYSSPSRVSERSTLKEEKPTPPYKTPPCYSSVVRRSPSGASFEFSPSPIQKQQQRQRESTKNVDKNIDTSSKEKTCDKLDVLECISNHSNQEGNYEEITNLDKAKEGVKDIGYPTEPKTCDFQSTDTIYDRLASDVSKESGHQRSSDRISRKKSLVLSARQRASLVCPGGLSEDSLLRETLQKAVDSLNIADEHNDSVSQWLQELRLMTEPECLTALQSKILAKDDVNLVNVCNQNTKDMVQIVYAKAVNILDELGSILQMMDETENWNEVTIRINLVISQMKRLIHNYRQASKSKLMFSLEGVLSEACLSISQHMNGQTLQASIMMALVNKMQSAFRKLIVEMLAQEITNVVEILENPTNEHALRTAVNNVSVLGVQGSEMCAIIAEAGGIRGLLTVILEKRYRFLRASAIRALATICCIPQSIRELENEGGIECITDILCDKSTNEQEKSEAAGVIAQITSPWIEYNKKIQGLAENAEDLVRSLTELAEKTQSPEVFLLATAALANITFVDSHACYYLNESRTITTLIQAARFTDKAHSLFAKDQIITVIANMSAVPEYRADVINNGGIVLLLCYLQERPTVVYNKAELAACERVQQKSAIAIARLTSEPDAAENVAKLQGIQRLVRLCKDEKERNCSDSVLIACLAALRKVTAKSGQDLLKELEAEDLIEMKLIENFKKYSSAQDGRF
ncbi:INSC (predicted) [Pycnogonum litorale]